MVRRKKDPVLQAAAARRVVVEARRLVVVDAAAPVWAAGGQAAELGDQAGAIVQVRPPAGASDMDILNVAGLYKGRGAVVVDVMPREPGGEVVVRRMRMEQRPSVTPRELVLGMAEKSVSTNRAGLRGLLAAVLDEEGL